MFAVICTAGLDSTVELLCCIRLRPLFPRSTTRDSGSGFYASSRIDSDNVLLDLWKVKRALELGLRSDCTLSSNVSRREPAGLEANLTRALATGDHASVSPKSHTCSFPLCIVMIAMSRSYSVASSLHRAMRLRSLFLRCREMSSPVFV